MSKSTDAVKTAKTLNDKVDAFNDLSLKTKISLGIGAILLLPLLLVWGVIAMISED